MSGETPVEIKNILKEIEENPTEKITDYGLIKRGIEPSKVRRWFLKNHGISRFGFHQMSSLNTSLRPVGAAVLNT